MFFYSIGYAENGLIPSSQYECLQALQRWGCKTNGWTRRVSTPHEALEAFDDAAKIRASLDFGIDGVVVKIDDTALQDRLGYVGRDPRWATAYKFPAEQAVTQLLEIRTHVGRTGAINPYAMLEPIVVGGVTVSRATLHNEEDINRKDIRAGDRVIVQRAGDVIPQVVGPSTDNVRGTASVPYRIDPECPACGEAVVRDADQADIRCVNSACPAQFERLLEHFASRGAMDIEGFGEKLAKELARQGLVADIAEIYMLRDRMDDLLAMERMGEKRAQNLVDAIERSKSQSLPRLIFGLGIAGVGGEIAETLSREFRSLPNLIDADAEKLTEIEGIGPILAKSICEWSQNEANVHLVQRLRRLGVDPIDDSAESDADHLIKGLTFVITGKLDSFSRTEAANAVKALGAKATGSVSKNTDYLVAGADAGSKLERAVRLNVPVLDEEQFKEILDGRLPDREAELPTLLV
jgi:DNA ligase (NAD+)